MDDAEQRQAKMAEIKAQDYRQHQEKCRYEQEEEYRLMKEATDILTAEHAAYWLGADQEWTVEEAVCLILMRRPPRFGCLKSESDEFLRRVRINLKQHFMSELPVDTWLRGWVKAGEALPIVLLAGSQGALKESPKKQHLRYLALVLEMLGENCPTPSDDTVPESGIGRTLMAVEEYATRKYGPEFKGAKAETIKRMTGPANKALKEYVKNLKLNS